jgi:putative flippase GtrA
MIRTVPRYLVVGLVCALLYNAALIGCDLLGIHYVVSNLIAYPIVVVCGFALHCCFTFERRPSAKSFLRYAAGMATNYPASIVLMFLFCDVAGLAVPLAAPVTTITLVAWNYLITRWAVTSKSALEGAA